MASQAPKVQSLAQAMKELNPAYSASQKIVNKQISNLKSTEAANIAGLNAMKGQSFNAINNQATGRGASFSGIPIDEQATYLSTKFLPGVQQAQADTRDATLNLQGRLADMRKEIRTNALSRIDQQRSQLNQWNMQQAQFKERREEAARERTFKAQQDALARQFSASQAAASRAASRAAESTPSANQYLASWAELQGENNKDYQSNWSFEKLIMPSLRANYGLSRDEAYKLRKDTLNY